MDFCLARTAGTLPHGLLSARLDRKGPHESTVERRCQRRFAVWDIHTMSSARWAENLFDFPSGRPISRLVAAFCISLVALMWMGLVLQFSAERELLIKAREAENDNLTKLFEEHVARTLAAATVTLREIETEYKIHGNAFDLAQYYRTRRAVLEPYSILSVVDAEGYLVLSTLPFTRPQYYGDLENTRFHINNPTQDIFIAKPRLGSVSGNATIYLTHRMNNADGSFNGNTGVGMDPRYFSRFYDQVDIGPNAVVSLIGEDGVTRAQRSATPGETPTIGQDMTGSSLFTKYLPRQAQGHFREAGAIDGIGRLYSYRTVEGYPLVVLVGTSEAAALTSLFARQRIYLVSAAVATVVILGFGALVIFQISQMRLTGATLRRNEERFRLFISGVTDAAIFTLDDRGAVITWNEGAERLNGYSADEVIGRPMDRFYTVEDRAAGVPAKLLRDAAEAGSMENEGWRLRKDGSLYRAEVLITAVRDEGRGLLGYTTVTRDITERRRAEAEAQESRMRLVGIIDSAMDAIITIDEQQHIVIFNHTAERVFGYAAAEMIGQPIERLIPTRFQASHRRHVDGFGKAGVTTRSMGRLGTIFGVRANGEEFPIEASISKVEIKGATNYTVILRDVVDRQRAQDALRQSESRLARAQSMAKIGNWELDLIAGRLVWSDEIYRLFELDPAQFGASYEAFLNAIHPDDRDRVNAAYTHSVKERLPYQITHRLLMSDGRIKFVEEHCETEYAPDGTPLRSLGTVQDVTDHVGAEETIRAALREKEILLKEVYHRVKNNLQVVSSLLRLQGRGISDPGTKQILQESANRVASMALVHEQLYRSGDLSNISFGKYVKQLVEHLMQAHLPLSQRVPVHIEVEELSLGIETAVPCGLIINELISNAYKHGYGADVASGEVWLRAERVEGGVVRILVADDGRGLPAAFDPRQVRSLGLQLVVTLTGQINGDLRYGSADGRTWFEVTFRPETPEADRLTA